MITENGAIKVNTAVDENVQKELSRNAYILSLICIIMGAIGFTVFLVLEILSVVLKWEDGDYIIMMIIFAVLPCGGISILVTINKNVNAIKSRLKVNIYEFYSDNFIVTETTKGEQTGFVKLSNNEITKVKETKNYLFLFINTAVAYPVAKAELSETELNTLRSIFKLPAKTNK